MKWSSQSWWSVELTDNKWTDDEWQWEQYDKQWWCNNDEDILQWQIMRIALMKDDEIFLKMKMIMMTAMINEWNLQKNHMQCWCDEISICFFWLLLLLFFN